MRELLERRPKIVTSESDQLVDLHHVRHHDLSKNNRRDPETANDPDGCQIETIMLDHQSPDHRYSLHPGELVFAKSWEEEDKFTLFSALATLVCIVSYIINIGTDVAVSYLLFVEGNFWWFGFTVASTAIPALTVNIFSIRWYMHDAQETKSQSEALAKPHTSKKDWIMRIFFHIVLLGPVLRNRKLRQQKQHEERRDWHLTFRKASPVTVDQSRDVDYHLLMIQEDRDTALLALLESFMESAPQLVLQIYILAQREEVPAEFLTVCFQVASVISSLFELSWALAFYQRALRRSVLDKKNMTRIGTALQFLWRFCTIGARVLALALFTSEYKLWIVPVCVGHWGIMTVWIMHQHTDFL
ncbi:XK-related protein 4-like isoform X2 [Tachypleus tridentatus]|uniref:XK-related protein 4-like isoform X2 n=1 Tax=Tachypleus tridentatus TaxID=6853 RepID=UPI003FD54F3F